MAPSSSSFVQSTLSRLEITHISSISLKTPDVHLTLPKVLLVYGLCKSLISISFLTSDLNCILLIDSHGFYVKDRTTGRTLLRGVNSNGLYHLNRVSPQILYASIGSQVASVTWHHHPDHSSSIVICMDLSHVHAFTSPFVIPFCDVYASNKSHKLPFSHHHYTAIQLPSWDRPPQLMGTVIDNFAPRL